MIKHPLRIGIIGGTGRCA